MRAVMPDFCSASSQRDEGSFYRTINTFCLSFRHSFHWNVIISLLVRKNKMSSSDKEDRKGLFCGTKSF